MCFAGVWYHTGCLLISSVLWLWTNTTAFKSMYQPGLPNYYWMNWLSFSFSFQWIKLQTQKFSAYKFVRRRKLYMPYFCVGILICTVLQHASLTPIQFIVHWVWNKTRRKLAFTVTFSLQGPMGYPKYLWRPSNALKGHSSQAWNHWWLNTEDLSTAEITSAICTSCSWW